MHSGGPKHWVQMYKLCYTVAIVPYNTRKIDEMNIEDTVAIPSLPTARCLLSGDSDDVNVHADTAAHR